MSIWFHPNHCHWDDVRIFSLKMLYFKPTWSCASISDLMAPVAKFQLTGNKVMFAMPFQSVSASFHATSPSEPPTLANLTYHMLSLTSKDFESGGGFCIYMTPGDFVWVRECCVIAEFGIGQPKSDAIATSLSWVALTRFHCSPESCWESLAYVKSVLEKCCEPSQKHLETQLKACS